MRSIFSADATDGHKYFRGLAEFHGREGHGHSVISAGSGHNSGARNFARQQIGERSARFERSGVLEQFQFECDFLWRRKSEIRGVNFNYWSAANVRLDEFVIFLDECAIDADVQLDGLLSIWPEFSSFKISTTIAKAAVQNSKSQMRFVRDNLDSKEFSRGIISQ